MILEGARGRLRPASSNPSVARQGWLSWEVGVDVRRRCSAREAVEGGRSWAEESAIGVRDFGARPCMCMLRPFTGAAICLRVSRGQRWRGEAAGS